MIKYIPFSTQCNSTVYYTSALKGKKNGQLLWNNCFIADLSLTQTLLAATQATRKSPSIPLGKSITVKMFNRELLLYSYYLNEDIELDSFTSGVTSDIPSEIKQVMNRFASILQPSNETEVEKQLSFFTQLNYLILESLLEF